MTTHSWQRDRFRLAQHSAIHQGEPTTNQSNPVTDKVTGPEVLRWGHTMKKNRKDPADSPECGQDPDTHRQQSQAGLSLSINDSISGGYIGINRAQYSLGQTTLQSTVTTENTRLVGGEPLECVTQQRRQIWGCVPTRRHNNLSYQ